MPHHLRQFIRFPVTYSGVTNSLIQPFSTHAVVLPEICKQSLLCIIGGVPLYKHFSTRYFRTNDVTTRGGLLKCFSCHLTLSTENINWAPATSQLYMCACVCVCVFKLASGNTGRWVGKSLIAAYRVIHSVYMCVSVCVCVARGIGLWGADCTGSHYVASGCNGVWQQRAVLWISVLPACKAN